MTWKRTQNIMRRSLHRRSLAALCALPCPNKKVARWVSPRREYLKQQFGPGVPSGEGFAKLLGRYYPEGFAASWPEHQRLWRLGRRVTEQRPSATTNQ